MSRATLNGTGLYGKRMILMSTGKPVTTKDVVEKFALSGYPSESFVSYHINFPLEEIGIEPTIAMAQMGYPSTGLTACPTLPYLFGGRGNRTHSGLTMDTSFTD